MEKQVIIQTKDGKKHEIILPQPSTKHSFYVFSLWKCGSSLLFQIFNDICEYIQIPAVNIDDFLFLKGYLFSDINSDYSSIYQKHGYAYTGFRAYWINSVDLSDNKSILLVRDPRDAMVSHYFSYLKSHSIPKEGPLSLTMNNERNRLHDIDIDSYVLTPSFVKAYKDNYLKYIENLSFKNTALYRYEDIIFRKIEWISDMVEFLGYELTNEVIEEIANRHDARPITEDPSKHIRQVSPGNFRKHLKSSTIEKLNKELNEIMVYFNYQKVSYLKMEKNCLSRTFS